MRANIFRLTKVVSVESVEKDKDDCNYTSAHVPKTKPSLHSTVAAWRILLQNNRSGIANVILQTSLQSTQPEIKRNIPLRKNLNNRDVI